MRERGRRRSWCEAKLPAGGKSTAAHVPGGPTLYSSHPDVFRAQSARPAALARVVPRHDPAPVHVRKRRALDARNGFGRDERVKAGQARATGGLIPLAGRSLGPVLTVSLPTGRSRPRPPKRALRAPPLRHPGRRRAQRAGDPGLSRLALDPEVETPTGSDDRTARSVAVARLGPGSARSATAPAGMTGLMGEVLDISPTPPNGEFSARRWRPSSTLS